MHQVALIVLVIVTMIVGWVINFVLLSNEADKSPEGAMGMGLFLLIGLVPFAIPVLMGVGWCIGKLSGNE